MTAAAAAARRAPLGAPIGVEAAELGSRAAPRPPDYRPLGFGLALGLGFALGAGTQTMAWRLHFDPALGPAVAVPRAAVLPLRVLAALAAAAAVVVLALRAGRWLAPLVLLLGSLAAVASLGPVYEPWRLVAWQLRWGARADARPYLCWGWAAAGGHALLAVAAVAAATGRHRRRAASGSHGTAAWGTGAALAGPTGVLLGRLDGRLIRDPGVGAILTVAPAGSGKGVGAVIPNLLDHPGSVLVNDPKGENYAVTARRRRALGQTVVALDPFGVTGPEGGGAAFNPLDTVDATSPDAIDDARTLADMLVVAGARGDDEGDDHWNPEASAWLAGLILHVAANEPPELRTLTRVRALLMLPPDAAGALLERMLASPACGGLVARAAVGLLQKADKERSGVVSTAKRHTNFLDSARMARSLGASTFDFAELKRGRLSVYLVLPADRLDSYKRWLRLMIACGMQAVIRTPGHPAHRVLCVLDEVANLGRMEPVLRAVRLLRGYGLRCWLVVQDLPTLRAVYGELAGALLAAADVLQAFGVNDLETAELLSRLTGDATIQVESENESAGVSRGRGGSSQRGAAVTLAEKGRRLLLPDEVRRLPPTRQLLFVKGQAPLLAERLDYRTDAEFAGQADANPMHGAVASVTAVAAASAPSHVPAGPP